ncbi:Hypothetical protein D9617_8g050560 [Elsinoe fawcettii]|nr:Hypothetical protein D9617_8g050560 [Elsinoe fawcettii]
MPTDDQKMDKGPRLDSRAMVQIIVGQRKENRYMHRVLLEHHAPELAKKISGLGSGRLELPHNEVKVLEDFIHWTYVRELPAAGIMRHAKLCMFAEDNAILPLAQHIMETLEGAKSTIKKIPAEDCADIWEGTIHTSPLRRFVKDWYKTEAKLDSVTTTLLDKCPDLAAWVLRSFMKDRIADQAAASSQAATVRANGNGVRSRSAMHSV